MTKDELLDAIAAGDMGEVEFMELALEIGMDLPEIEQAMHEARGEW